MSWNSKDIIHTRPCLTKQEVRAYLNKSLNVDQRFEIENHLLDCDLCSSAIQGYVQNPNEIDEVPTSTKKQNWFYLAAAAIITLLGVAAFFNYQSTNRPVSTFANYYQRPIWDVQTRGENEDSQYTNAISLYNQKHYEAALPIFDKLLEEYPEDNQLRTFKGISHLESNEFSSAIVEFQTVRINSDIYFEEATWYLALLNIKTNNTEEAKVYLEELSNLENGFFYQKAMELKNGLQE